jgi:hypothetical protein
MKGKKMKFAKLFSIMLLGIMLVSAVSHAQSIPSGTARYEALGYNPFIKDASIDINRNPAWTTVYRNYAFGDLGREVVNQYELTEQFGAVNFGVSKDVALGLVLNKFEDNWTDFNRVSNGVQRPVVPLKVLFGWQMSPKFALGLAPYYASWSTEHDSTSLNQKHKSSSLGGTVGILGKMDGGWIEGAVDVKTNKFKNDYTIAGVNSVYENEGGLQMDIFTRGFFTVNKNLGINLVPYLAFGMYGWNETTTPTIAGGYLKFSHMNFRGGIGINMPILGDGMLAGGLTAGYYSFEKKQEVANEKETYTEFTLPQFNLGAEWPLTDWLTGRLGYSRAVISTKDEYTTGTAGTWFYSGTGVSDSKQTITAGFGLHFNRFSLDGTVGEKLFKEGFYILTGKTNDMFGMLSVSYNFAK